MVKIEKDGVEKNKKIIRRGLLGLRTDFCQILGALRQVWGGGEQDEVTSWKY